LPTTDPRSILRWSVIAVATPHPNPDLNTGRSNPVTNIACMIIGGVGAIGALVSLPHREFVWLSPNSREFWTPVPVAGFLCLWIFLMGLEGFMREKRRKSITDGQDGYPTSPETTNAAIRKNPVSRTIKCPTCDNPFPLPAGWMNPPFRCPYCKEQLQAKVRFAGLPRYLWWITTPISLLIVMNHGWLPAFLFLLGYVAISVIAGAVSATVFPLDIAPYESSVPEMNLTK
jgi:hypothetical protein